MKKQYSDKYQCAGKYSWHLMAWGMALSYLLLHHAFAWASFHAPVREVSVPTVVAEAPVRPLVSGIHHRQRLPVLKHESLWPAQLEGGCHLVTLSVDALGSRGVDDEQGEMEVNTTLCHVEL